MKVMSVLLVEEMCAVVVMEASGCVSLHLWYFPGPELHWPPNYGYFLLLTKCSKKTVCFYFVFHLIYSFSK